MAGNVTLALPSTYAKFSVNSLLVLTKDNDPSNYLITEQYAVAEHNDACSLEKCKYHILLYCQQRGQDQLLLQLKGYSFRYIMVDDLYSFYRFYVHGTLKTLHGTLMEDLKWAVGFSKRFPSCVSRPSILKKRVCRKKSKLHSKMGYSSTVATQTQESNFSKRIESILDGSFCLDFIKIIDCLYDKHGIVCSSKLEFLIKK